ncbi:hypothetical protein [Deinococcus radiodurans]|mgnify:CR=1 FL=1|uniref:Uncharacterized protein n=1 Tax=Deinococcus radiodurans (strain ATCC 13939 / DSM 20539 / JCM 16871 / CCUG 27074 / LMG 4051 / NBRC 15346 / NCIMB 9279 / VKM B-1422 / R1) TaxID=243230 RepID=Q9RWY7_DEIRA|nr:hypothetical protein [Deinococcus radiodurans]AAF10110.1 hypothetical protein DR_0528 [Deinococcus radiodurans R1 = ATCC 13939 = DSM 20539]ANC72228.1 hypothetical protein A2G07_10875 [Deinococcus radiodurans R1 = ATCC 13939 = DSM 20539]QEM72476.1 hypothetical protein DXG80_12325 [Deinococcus radiodurans]QIP28705.1 hypothetical protein HAV23_05530 [Deinococcus radiodurans]QIP32591.1 hypothetical protein HAV35_11275 [Deinococcus radiodurans]
MNGENYETNAAGVLDMPQGQTVERDPRGANAQRHGILSEHVSEGEREAYAQHVEQIRASTGAASYLEQRLADRAALALWRLDRVARYEAAQIREAQRSTRAAIAEGEGYRGTGNVKRARARLADAAGTSPHLLAAVPGLPEHKAAQHDRAAAHLSRWAGGGSAEGLGERDAAHLGAALAGELLDADPPARAGDMVRAMLGRAPRRGEAASVEGHKWTYEPGELPGLLAFYREFWGDEAGEMLGESAEFERGEAAKIRAAQREALSAEADALALAALPGEAEAQKVTRYEAHLERVLYRALHDLEAARREREGRDTPGPLRGVLGEQHPSE